jgi:AcrR family transcriptional regulator
MPETMSAEAADDVTPKPRTRDADATKARILEAAKAEFARLGLGGARVDEIADKARANKRMIYHYFGSKEELFTAVLEEAYLDIRTAEQELKLSHLSPREALVKLVTFTWTYYLENPEFIRLVNSANLHGGRHIAGSERLRTASRRFTQMVRDILDRGVAQGVFRPGIDPVQLNITIAAIGYYYLTNRFTGAILFERDFMKKEALAERLKFNIDTVMRLVEAD